MTTKESVTFHGTVVVVVVVGIKYQVSKSNMAHSQLFSILIFLLLPRIVSTCILHIRTAYYSLQPYLFNSGRVTISSAPSICSHIYATSCNTGQTFFFENKIIPKTKSPYYYYLVQYRQPCNKVEFLLIIYRQVRQYLQYLLLL